MMISKKEWLVMDNSEMLPQKADGSLKFQITTLAENTDAQHNDSWSRKHGSSRFHVAGVPLQSCFCAVTMRVLWTGQSR